MYVKNTVASDFRPVLLKENTASLTIDKEGK